VSRKVPTVMLVAAEASGDDRGAGLARALRRKLNGQVRFVGVGGTKMRAEGVDSPFDIAELSIFGFLEGILALPRVLKRASETADLAVRERPDIAVLIDSWGFTLRVAQRLRRRTPDISLIKYVGPQVWASRPWRAKTTARWFDRLLAIHSFDAPLFERAGLPVTFVGNATLAQDFSDADGRRLRGQIGAGPDEPMLLVLPGSRPSEIARVLPAFEAAVTCLKAARPDLHVVVLAAPTVTEMVQARVAGWRHRATIVEGEEAKRDAMAAATVALACSGTVTTELALARCPMVVGYRLGPVTYAMLKPLIRTKYVTLFNIAAQAFVAPELIQKDCNGPNLAREVLRRLEDPAFRDEQVARQSAALIKMGLGGPDPDDAAADAVVQILAEAQRLSTVT
jgi:lipid-A-disaccharide synthase